MAETYVSADVSKEIARDLVGLNQVVVRPSSGHGVRLFNTRYFASFANAEAVIKALFLDLDVKELWVGITRRYEKELKDLIFLLDNGRREYGHIVLGDNSGTVHNIVFK